MEERVPPPAPCVSHPSAWVHFLSLATFIPLLAVLLTQNHSFFFPVWQLSWCAGNSWVSVGSWIIPDQEHGFCFPSPPLSSCGSSSSVGFFLCKIGDKTKWDRLCEVLHTVIISNSYTTHGNKYHNPWSPLPSALGPFYIFENKIRELVLMEKVIVM